MGQNVNAWLDDATKDQLEVSRALRHDSFASGSLMVCAVFLLIGIVDNDKKVKNQPDEWNNNRFNHDPLPCCLDASFLAASSMTIRM